ncbi:MAG: NAD(+)/NADH kinase [Bdellovibrionales bacterium]|nr:NAD(+)/NADH kinase [Bdellovibrionales bacterium]
MSKKISCVAIVYRPNSEIALSTAINVAQWFKERKIKVVSHPQRGFKLNGKKIPVYSSKNKICLVVVIGGDGTYLEAIRMLNGRKIPILGVNLGSLGFLTETRLADLYPTLEMALNGKMEERPRSMIRVKVKRKNKVIVDKLSLNDVVIERGARSHLIFLNIVSNNQDVGDVKADGLIISTPTGSTAYNLAAGGPILHPEVQAFVVTPICPHSLTNRPIIFPDSNKLKFNLAKGTQTASLTVDGINVGTLNSDDVVSIEKNPKMHYVLKKPSHNYFHLLTEKLKFGERS